MVGIIFHVLLLHSSVVWLTELHLEVL